MKDLFSKIFLCFAMIVVIVMAALAFAIPGDILGRQVSFVVLDVIAIVSICVSINILFRGAWEMLSVRKRSACSWLILLSLFACIFVVFPVFLEQWNIYVRAVLVGVLLSIALVTLAVNYHLSFKS
jgi:hypothetical protein